jgi:hypothetical protein
MCLLYVRRRKSDACCGNSKKVYDVFVFSSSGKDSKRKNGIVVIVSTTEL